MPMVEPALARDRQLALRKQSGLSASLIRSAGTSAMPANQF
jgi:hypothetical protein